MQAIAKEIGFSETTFVTEAAGDRYAMRIFTPGPELPFAGHPTLGTAFVMVSEGRVSTPATQVIAAGEIPVEVDVEAHRLDDAVARRVRRHLPRPRPDRERDRAHELEDLAAELPVQTVSTGLPTTIVPVRDVETLRRATRNERLVG